MIRVLLVDDSSIVTEKISDYLSKKGYSVEIKNSPFGVMTRLREFKPQVVLMDLDLPVLRGDKLIDLCRDKVKESNWRVIIFSSAGVSEMRELVKKGTAHDYFLKGGSLRELEEKIKRQAAASEGAHVGIFLTEM